jgi:HEPN domain-containing protein
MRPEESGYPTDWLRIAERDLSRVNRCLRDSDPEAAGFFLQQTLEKFTKVGVFFCSA